MKIGSFGRPAGMPASCGKAGPPGSGGGIALLFVLLAATAPMRAFGNPCPTDPNDPHSWSPLTGHVVTGDDSLGFREGCEIGKPSKSEKGSLELFGTLSVAQGGEISVTSVGSLFIDSTAQLAIVGGVMAGAPGGEITVAPNGVISLAAGGIAGIASATTNQGFIRNTSNFMFSLGTLDNSGTIANLAGATLFTFDGEAVTSSGTLDNNATMALTGDARGATVFENSGQIFNRAAASLTLALDATLGNTKTIVNDGFFRLFSPTNVLTNKAGGFISNTATGSFTNAGTVNTEASSSFANAGRATNNGSFNNAGLLGNLTNGPVGGSFTNAKDFDNKGTVNSAAGTLFDNQGSFTNRSGGVINTLSGAQFDNAGRLDNEGGGTFSQGGQINNAGTFLNSGTLVNRGTLLNSGHFGNVGSEILSNYGGLTNSGTFTNSGFVANESGASFDNKGTLVNDQVLHNDGTVYVSGTISGTGGYTQTSGLTKLQGGSISQSLIDIKGGSLLGKGTLTQVHLDIGATLGPGDPNLLTLTDSLVVDGGDLLFQIAGKGAGEYDMMKVGKTVTLHGGHIVFDFIGGYRPSAGDSFADFLTAGGGISGLDSIGYQFLGVGPDLRFAVAATNSGALSLQVAAVPEPGTALLLLIGLAPLAAWMRRRETAS